jgi:LacI family transcriptional regulator
VSVSIKDVAKRAGVSAGTVSNVFSGNRAVRPDLVARVRSASEELGYQPDRAASHLRAGKARVIAALVPDLTNPFFTGLLASVESSVRDEGLNIIVASSNGDPAEERAHLSALLAWRPAGLVVVPCNDDFVCRELITRAGVPFVVADRVPSDFDGDAVTVDNAEAGRLAAEHLVGLGHRDIVVAASTLKLQNIRERCEGIERVFATHGLQPPSRIEVGLDFEAAAERLAVFMEGGRQPTAFLALTNFGTLGVLASLQKWNLSVPLDVSVLGFDDYSWMRAVVPPLTAIRQPIGDMGHEIWSRLRARIRGNADAASRVKLSCELVVRASTAQLRSPELMRERAIGRRLAAQRKA